MKIAGPLISGRFIDRPNRFITRVKLNGNLVISHLPDPGRLRELLFPGVEVYLHPAPKNSSRKTRYTTVMVRHGGVLISLVSALPNRFVKLELERGGLPMLAAYNLDRTEVHYGHHRFDFLLRDKSENPFYLEVKSVTFVQDGVAQFPDAVTARGTRHANALVELVKQGAAAGILFVCQRSDAESFRPMHERDPKFATALSKAYCSGVNVWCITTKVTLEEMTYYREIPIALNGKNIT